MAPIDFDQFDAVTFDCYGTLIDWEAGIAPGLAALFASAGETAGSEDLLERYGRHEADLEGGPYRRYREVVAEGGRRVAAEFGVVPTEEALVAFGDSVGEWPSFPDSAQALRRLATRFRLGVITNCDDDLFTRSNRRLEVDFDWVFTAQQIGGYKPDPRNFAYAFERMDVPRERVLHVAQSLFHDHVPAKAIGLTTVWIDRRGDRPGSGATPPAAASPDLVLPSMAAFAKVAVPD
jgi:2-haloacid dehalogenase